MHPRAKVKAYRATPKPGTLIDRHLTDTHVDEEADDEAAALPDFGDSDQDPLETELAAEQATEEAAVPEETPIVPVPPPPPKAVLVPPPPAPPAPVHGGKAKGKGKSSFKGSAKGVATTTFAGAASGAKSMDILCYVDAEVTVSPVNILAVLGLITVLFLLMLIVYKLLVNKKKVEVKEEPTMKCSVHRILRGVMSLTDDGNGGVRCKTGDSCLPPSTSPPTPNEVMHSCSTLPDSMFLALGGNRPRAHYYNSCYHVNGRLTEYKICKDCIKAVKKASTTI